MPSEHIGRPASSPEYRAGRRHRPGEPTPAIPASTISATSIIDGTIYTYDEKGHPASKEDCKKGGWMNFVKDDGQAFKNQGDCVSYVNGT